MTKELATTKDNGFVDMVRGLAENPQVDVDKLQKIMEMQEHILDRNAKQDFNSSMVKAQQGMPIVPEDMRNNQTGSNYSSYKAIIKHCKPVYTKEGFSIMFYEGDTAKEGCIRVCAKIMHSSGHTEEAFVDVPMDDKGIKGSVNKTQTHAKGSSVSYGRSYLIKMIFNIPTGEDDDGNGAGDDYITEEQENKLTAMIEENELSQEFKAKWLQFVGAESISLITAKNFNRAIGGVKDAIKRKANASV